MHAQSNLVASRATSKRVEDKGIQTKTKSVGRSIAQSDSGRLLRTLAEKEFEKQFTDLLHDCTKTYVDTKPYTYSCIIALVVYRQNIRRRFSCFRLSVLP